MRMSIEKPCFAALMLGAALAACGGNVVVDGTSPGGGGATTSASTATGMAGGASCFTRPPSGSLNNCGATGNGTMCTFTYCQNGSPDTWQATCTSGSCVCSKNSQELCTCALATSGDFCDGTPDCCFH